MLDALGDSVTGAGPAAFWIWVLAGIAGAAAAFWYGFAYLRKARLVEDTPTARLRSAPQGFIELDGACYLLDGEPIVSPLSGRRCTWYSYKVQERNADRSSGEKAWRVVEAGVSESLFLLRDETGECVVDPEGADVVGAEKRTWTGSGADRTARAAPRFGSGDFRYTEELLLPAAPLFAIGYLRTHDGVGNWDTAAEVRALLSAWKKDQPALIERFDTDRDGEISLTEWERARNAARAEVDALRRDAATRPGLNVLTAPPDGRPFILAASPQRRLARRYRWRAIAGLCGFFLSTATTLYLMVQRFG